MSSCKLNFQTIHSGYLYQICLTIFGNSFVDFIKDDGEKLRRENEIKKIKVKNISSSQDSNTKENWLGPVLGVPMYVSALAGYYFPVWMCACV